MSLHLMFDVFAYIIAATSIYATRKMVVGIYSTQFDYSNIFYFIVATTGAMVGSVFFGSINLYIMGENPWLAKSVLGGIVGGIFAVELMKQQLNIYGSTGAILVIGLCFGVAIGRVGCYFSGLTDYTHGVITDSFVGVDYGDGLKRYPVQLFESSFMFLFGVYCLFRFKTNKNWMMQYGFYLFCSIYALQRFIWEFLKPYPELLLGLNLFQFLCIALFLYAVTMLLNAQMVTNTRHERTTNH